MKASEITFDRMMIYAAGNFSLAEPTSFIQVEYGIKDLKACWDGFVDTSDDAGLVFKNKKDVCESFSEALNDYILYLEFSAVG